MHVETVEVSEKHGGIAEVGLRHDEHSADAREECRDEVAIDQTRAGFGIGGRDHDQHLIGVRDDDPFDLIGVVCGAPVAVAAATLLRSLLFGLAPGNPLVLISVGLAFVALGAAAGIIPALRAARIAPATALRTD